MRTIISIVIFYILIIGNHTDAYSQKFKKIEKSIKKSDNIPNAISDGNSSQSNSMEGITEIIGLLLYSFPKEEDLQEMYGAPIKLSKYPYSGKDDGRYTRIPNQDNLINLDFQANYFYESNAIQGIQAFSRVQFMPKVSFDFSYSHLQEEVFNEEPLYFDFLHLNISYHRLAFTRFDFWIGTGFTSLWLDENYTGWNINIGTEIFIKKPFSLSTNWYIGGIEEVNFTEGSTDLKVYISRLNLYAGYQLYKIGDISIQGPRAGLGITL